MPGRDGSQEVCSSRWQLIVAVTGGNWVTGEKVEAVDDTRNSQREVQGSARLSEENPKNDRRCEVLVIQMANAYAVIF